MDRSQTQDHNALKRKVMKKRLSKWDSFFSQLEEKFSSSSVNEIHSAEENLPDQQLLQVQEEHREVTKSLRMDYGINEDSEISDSDISQYHNIENLNTTDNYSSAPSEDERGTSNSPDTGLNSKLQKVKIQGIEERNPKSSLNECNKKPESFCADTLSKTDPKENEFKRPNRPPTKGCSRRSKSFAELNVRHGRVIQKAQINVGKQMLKGQQDPKSNSSVTTNLKQKGSDSPRKRTASYVSQEVSDTYKDTGSEPDSSCYQSVDRESIVEMCNQYELWKRHKRRESGHHGSLYIVKSLSEEPTDENRYIPELPPISKEPFPFRRRFSLKKL